MPGEYLSIYDFGSDRDIQESLRLALMFREEIDGASQAFLEMLLLSVEPTQSSTDELKKLFQEAINSALLTGIRTYRNWLQSEGIDVKAVEMQTGKDIPPDFFQGNTRYPL